TQYALINEGAQILAEGIAQSAGDVDRVYRYGYGYPESRGGPMAYADSIGLSMVLERVEEFYARFGERWRPAPLLIQLAAAGGSFASFKL
ncbi:MAG: 3-hydroxyacyl-CoA dehydrogenase, partial [Acidobacteria bacterium]|nr:3-hydroxyacyl-CoA dehydrogenase [Acidobacteriota bacterium]